MSWIPLHVYSQYSVLEASASIDKLVRKAKEYGLSHLALTDQGNMYGAVEFSKACSAAGIRPIVGCKLFMAPESRLDKKKMPGVPAGLSVVLLAKNETGYKNLCQLSSKAHLEGFYWTPRIDKELLAKHREGLICLCGGPQSVLSYWISRNNTEKLNQEIDWFLQTFGQDFYFELMRHEMATEAVSQDGLDQESWLLQQYEAMIQEQKLVNETLVKLSQEIGVQLVATNGSRYVEREEWRSHEVLINIQSGEPVEVWEKDSYGNPKNKILNPKRQVYSSHELYFKSPLQMQELFADLPQAIENTEKIANECHFEFDFKTKHYPLFVPPELEGKPFAEEERKIAAEQYLRTLCKEGIERRYTPDKLAKVQEKYPDNDPLQVIEERLDYELSVILPKGMGDYLLIVWDFIHWAKQQKIPMGPGRGSGAGSIILYLIGITDIEPLRFNLFFERFINPERLSYPDIDVDICMDRRPEVIDYTVKKYGSDRVAQIITFGTMKAKMAIKDVGRVLSIPLARVNQIAKLIPEDPSMTLEEALKLDPELSSLYREDEEVTRLIDLARQLEGSVRNTGIHAAGMIISARPLVECCPLCRAKDSDMAVTQYSMKPVEAVGMLKIDFLGLKTLTTIQYAINAIEKNRKKTIDWVNLPFDDKPTFDLLNQGKTMGIFQMESGGMQDLARQLHIDTFEEIIAVVSLYRPGPMEMIPSFVERKHGREAIEIDHPLMEGILKETNGIMVYQEQVMAIASQLAGYSLGEGDVLRRAMGKKDKAEMARQRVKFREGALEKGIDEETSMMIFDKIEKFASYGFNKSHAAAYGYVGYVTAYLKANYTAEWLAALMTTDRDDLTKVAKHMHEAKQFQLAVLPPDVNESGQEFVATSQGIRFAMGGIKGVGTGVVDVILKEREKKGPFASLYDFVSRVEVQKVGKRVIEYLIESGCFDFTSWSRPQLLAALESMYDDVAKEQKESAKGVISIFSLMKESPSDRFVEPPTDVTEISKQQTLRREHELLGIYLNGHPLDEFQSQLTALSCVPLAEIDLLPGSTILRAAFIIEKVVMKISNKTQRKFAIATVGDGVCQFELPIWSDLYEKHGALIVENQLIYAVLQKEIVSGEMKLQCRWLTDLTSVDEAVVQECDTAYEYAKVQMRKMQMRYARDKQAGGVKKEEKKEQSVCELQVDAEKLRLSEVLALKALFSKHRGEVPVEIIFQKESGAQHALHIDKSWGVKWSTEFEEKLSQVGSFRSKLKKVAYVNRD